ncbi:MAG: hypothetical protein WED04_06330 [Promethearchaeati archaeon SRVP18_Atabeyarchaeia-1]
MKNRSALLFTLLFAVCIAVSSLDSYAATYAASAPNPRATFAPALTLTGTGPSINLLDSVYGWQWSNQMTVNSYTTCRGPRNSNFSHNAPTGFLVSSQSLLVSELVAAPDFREVQFAPSPNNTLTLKNTASSWQRLAMRFVLPDTANLTSVWMCYSSNSTTMPLQVYSTGSISTYTPQGGKLVATVTLPPLPNIGWGEVKFTRPLNLTRGNYYWVVVNASGIPANNVIHWGYVGDAGASMDQRPMAAYATPTSWWNETRLGTYINLMLVLRVLPVVDGNPSQVMTYSSSDKVDMTLNVTQPRPDACYFNLGTNTSIAFVENWTARFEKHLPMSVETGYKAQPGSTNWTARFFSATRPYDPYVWYNRTLTVMSIPLDWEVNLATDVTNDKNINFTAAYSAPSSMYIVQTDNVDVSLRWDATWTIVAMSHYSVSSSTPSLVIRGKQLNIGITAPVSSTRCRITIFNSTDFVALNRTVLIPSTSTYFPVRLNQTGNFVMTLLDTADYPDISYLTMPINVTAPLTSFNLQSSSLRATWGDAVTIAFRYRNTTLGSDQEFPGTPIVNVTASSLNFTAISVQAAGGGWFSFVIETRLLPSSGDYILTIIVSYSAMYLNQTTMLLHIDPQGLSPLPIFLAGGGSAGAVIAVVAAWRYRTRRKVKEEKKMKILRQTASLAQLVVVELRSGLTTYSRSLGTEETVDPNLISGFLTANQSIMGQVFKGKAPSGLRFADYGEYKVVSHVGKHVMSALFCTEAAGEELQDLLKQFTDEFEKKYQKELVGWNGDLEVLRGADTIADNVFSIRLISPYILELDRLTKVKLSWMEKAAVDEARRLSATRSVIFMPRIFDYLLTKRKLKRSKIVATVDSLVEEGVFKQLTVNEAALIMSQTENASKSSDEIGDDQENGA